MFPRWIRDSMCLLAVSLGLSPAAVAAETPPIPARELVRQSVANELKASTDQKHYMFRSRKQNPAGSQTRILVQTRDAVAAMAVAFNDQPLSSEQRQAEEGRLQFFMSNPQELRRKQQKEKDDADRVNHIVRALPDAFLYDYDGSERGQPGIGKPGDQLLRLKFRPDPRYQPPSRVEQVLVGMQGVVLVDAEKRRIAKIDGKLFKDVSFGWGILGHLDKGGEYHVEQGDVGNDSFEITKMSLTFTGKLLLFKNIVINSNEAFSDFHGVPENLTFAQGVALLKQQAGGMSSTATQAQH